MMFLLTFCTCEDVYRTFSIQGISLGTGLDVINKLASQGDHLVNIRYVDEDGGIELPTGIFDGTSFSAPLEQLEQEWQQLLSPANSLTHLADADKDDPPPCIEQRQSSKRNRIKYLQSYHWRIQQLIERTQQSMKASSQKDRLLAHYQRVLRHFGDSLCRVISH